MLQGETHGKISGCRHKYKEAGNINCFIIHLGAALGRESKQGEAGVGREGEALRLPGLGGSGSVGFSPLIFDVRIKVLLPHLTASAGSSRKRQNR